MKLTKDNYVHISIRRLRLFYIREETRNRHGL